MKRVKVFFHDNCFDGAASAALFAAFYRHHVDGGAEVLLQGLHHQIGDPFAGHAFDADDHACVDFRYSPKLSWWFDHHVSAFQPAELRAHFEADTGGQRFYDPAARSCTKFMADTLRERFGWAAPGFDELVHWADIIDGAQFADAKTAVELAAPALQLMAWLENNRDEALAHRYIRALGHRPLAELAAEPWVRESLDRILAAHRRHIELIGERVELRGDVVYFDLLDDAVGPHNKFIAYMLFPDARYVVGLTRLDERCKISVGFNPWCGRERGHDIAKICERYGGGGHPVVGGVSYGPGEIERTRQTGTAICANLMAEPS